MSLATIKTTCVICGDVDLDTDDITLVPGVPTMYRFRHCGTVTEREANLRVEVVLRAVGVRETPAPPSHCSLCGVAMFRIGPLTACRNCDPMPGLPPADRSCGR